MHCRSMTEPLTGIRVIDVTVAVQGPAAGLYLGDMGAEVIKIEPPIGDGSRYMRGRGNETPPGTVSPQFVAVNRGKRSVCIDLTTDVGKKALLALLDTADVLITNYRDRALEKLGFGYDDLKTRYPRLIYASVNGFGPQGPDAEKAMLDGAAVARGGLASMTGTADNPPAAPGAIMGDTSGAMQLALGVMTALFAREKTGTGQRVQTSGLGTQLWLQQWEITHTAMTGAKVPRDGSHHPLIKGPDGVSRTRCGGAILLALPMTQEAWDAVCVFGGAFELASDPRFDSPGKRLGNGITGADSEEVRGKLRNAFASKSVDEWEDFLRTEPEVIWERVRDWHDVLDDEQNLANGYIETIEVPGFGTTRTVGNLVTLSSTPGSVKGGPPELGEGNDELLAAAGLTAEEIEAIHDHAESVRAALRTAS